MKCKKQDALKNQDFLSLIEKNLFSKNIIFNKKEHKEVKKLHSFISDLINYSRLDS
jgi:hypothetical protein